MKTITLEVPDGVKIDEQDAKRMLAARLFEKGELSLGQAAEFVGETKHAFMARLSEYGVSFFDESAEAIDADLRHAKNHHR